MNRYFTVIRNVLGAIGLTLLAAAVVGVLNEQRPLLMKGAQAQSTVLGPNLYAYTAVTSSQQLIGANPTRHALQICNPGGTNILWIAPQGTAVNTGAAVTPAANGAGTVGVPVTSSGTVPCFSPPTNAPSIGQGWNGFSTTTPVTVYEWP